VLRWLQAQGLFPRRYELGKVGDSWEHHGGKEAQSLSDKEETPGLSSSIEALTSSVALAEPLASARQLSYLLVKDPERLERKERHILAFLLQEPELDLASHMTNQLRDLLKNKQGIQLWLGSAFAPPVASRSWKHLRLACKKSCQLFKPLALFPTTMAWRKDL
jgi:hypothetical protein